MTNAVLDPTTRSESATRQRQAESVVNIGLFFNTVLAATKLLAGIVGHSQALLADGVNSVSDVIYFIVVKIFVRMSGKPADSEHPYGHHQFESIAALVVGAFVISTGAAIFWDAVNCIFDLIVRRSEARPIPLFALAAGVATVLAKLALMFHATTIARKTNNLAVLALARDHRNDIFSSLGATAGIVGSMVGVQWFDALAGALVAVVVAKTGFDILREASSDLMDNVPGDELAKHITSLLGDVAGVDAVEDIRAHRFGPYLVVNLTIGIDGGLTVREGDLISDNIEQMLVSNIEMLKTVYVHYHPVTVPATH